MKHRAVPVLSIVLPAALFLLSCATDYTSSMRSVTRDLRLDRPELALESYRETFTDSTGKNRLLYLMELGNLNRLTGNYERAIGLLLQADRLSDMQRGVNVGQQVGSFLTSDLALEFRGADYEKVFINYCLAASYASRDNMMDALVECRRVNDKLRAMNLQYEDQPNRYSDDAFIRYLMGVLYEKAGDYNNALIAYRNSARVYDSSYVRDYGISTPSRVKADILRLAHRLNMNSVFQNYSRQWPGTDWEGLGPSGGNGEVVVILEAGVIPPKVETKQTFLVDDRLYSIALPAMPDRSRESYSVRISSDGLSSAGFLAEDVTDIARKNLEDHAGRDVARAVARLAVKAGVSEAGEEIMEELTHENSTVSQLTGFFISLFGAATEQADLRAWLTLPSQIYVARLALPEGISPVEVTVNGRSVYSDPAMSIQSGEIQLLFLRDGGK